MSKVINFNLNSNNNSGKITDFNYSRNLNELAGTWSANIAGGNFTAGDTINFSGVMKNGVISKAYKNANGLWIIEGKDAGIRLMRTTPQTSLLPKGNAKAVISDLANFCNVPLSMNVDGLDGFNVRSVITGSTCAEAILELAMLSGLIAYINNSGTLVIRQPTNIKPILNVILDNSGSEMDLDGYATQVTAIITRRKERVIANAESVIHYAGTTPSLSPQYKNKNGLFSYGDMSGSYSVTVLSPFGMIKEAVCSITSNGVTVKTTENHNYNWKSKTVWRDSKEYVLFAFCETGYSMTRETRGAYKNSEGESVNFTETTTETMSRSMSVFDTPWVPSDWKGELGMVDKEEITRSTTRTGGADPTENMPAYSPPFDSQITRSYERADLGRGVVCSELEITYEARQIGSIAPVKQNDEEIPYFMSDSPIAIQSHSTPAWVRVENYRTYYEGFNSDGECEISTKSEWSDDGARWMLENAIIPTGDETQDKYQEDYAKFSQKARGLDISLKSNGISTSAWQFLELAGRTKIISDKNYPDKIVLNTREWYNNGQYAQSVICPHYNLSQKTCNIYGISAVGDFEGQACPIRGENWSSCVRALAALEQARTEYDSALLEAPIVGIAKLDDTEGNPAAGYQREIYIDDIITNNAAQDIADTIAENILKVKGTKGFLKTVVIPYNPDFLPDGEIVSVSHDLTNMKTTINYRESGVIPDFMIPSSMAGIASIISDRDAGRRTRPMSGTITAIDSDGVVTVNIGGMSYQCDTKLFNLGVNDAVLVSFISGNKIRGQIIERL